MKTTYYEANEPGSYSGVRALTRYSGKPVKTAKGWLETQDPYTLHKPVVKKFPRRKTFAKGVDDLFQADLADMRNLASSNDGNSYILTCIDVFSRYAFAVPSKTRDGRRWRRRSKRYLPSASPTCCRRIAVRNSTTSRCRSCLKRTARGTTRVSTTTSKPRSSRDLTEL
jgi:hypothetical protein